jgi:hypothetical protein
MVDGSTLAALEIVSRKNLTASEMRRKRRKSWSSAFPIWRAIGSSWRLGTRNGTGHWNGLRLCRRDRKVPSLF